jgi:hypothetical protein
MQCRLVSIADAETDSEFENKVLELQNWDVWNCDTALHNWFTNTWLSEKHVSTA